MTATLEKRDRTFLLVTAVIFLLGFMLRVWGLSSQPLSGDDVGVAVSACNYMERGQVGPTMWNHPHLRDILVYCTMQCFGTGVWGVKTASFIFGILSVPLVALAAKRLFSSREIAWVASFLLAVDSLHIDYSRQGVHEIYMAFFALLGIYAALRSQDGESPFWLVVAGLAFGLGIASKWYVAFPLAVTWGYLLYNIVVRNTGRSAADKGCKALFVCCALVLIPLTVYLVTFIPWFQRGYDLAEWVSLQQGMLAESKLHTGYSGYLLEIDHNAYLWFLKPVAYVDTIFGEGVPTFLLAVSNPLVWLLALPATAYLAYRGFREKCRQYLFVVALFTITYLQFLVLNRPLWAHTAFSVLPFALMAIAFLLIEAASRRRWGGRALSVYLLLVMMVSMPLYLLGTGRGRSIPFINTLVDSYRPANERQ